MTSSVGFQEIARIRRSHKTDLVISIIRTSGTVYIDIREFARKGRYSGPTKKGVRIPRQMFPEILKELSKI